MKAKEITWKGMTFRSKLEARYYNHFKNLGWDFDYEPDVPGLVGYQPDFVLYPHKNRHALEFPEHKPIYVEIKPIRDTKEYFNDPNYDDFRNKIKKYWDPKNDLVLFGGNLFNRGDSACLALSFNNEIFDKLTSYSFAYSYSNTRPHNIGLVMWQLYEYLSDHQESNHIFPPEMLDGYEYGERFKGSQKISYDKLETSWNNAWSQMRWEAR